MNCLPEWALVVIFFPLTGSQVPVVSLEKCMEIKTKYEKQNPLSNPPMCIEVRK